MKIIKNLKVAAMMLLCMSVTGTGMAAVDFTTADKMYLEERLKECETELNAQMAKASTDKEKCEVYWRLARLQVVYGEFLTSKEEKRPYYAKGKEYADKAIAADKNNPYAYMWHIANVGREAQTKSIFEQMKIVSTLNKDLGMIINTLGKTEISEAWQALAEYYLQAPGKSATAAIAYARKAAMCIPANESRLSTYIFFAETLYKKDRSASKRKSIIDEQVAGFKDTSVSNIDKYACFEGSLGSSYVPAWSKKNLGSMSDHEEALAIVEYAIKLYNSKAVKTKRDNIDYKKLTSLKNDWQ